MKKLAAPLLALAALMISGMIAVPVFGQTSRGSAKADRDSGVWIDGRYVGYLKELKGDKRIDPAPARRTPGLGPAGKIRKLHEENGTKCRW